MNALNEFVIPLNAFVKKKRIGQAVDVVDGEPELTNRPAKKTDFYRRSSEKGKAESSAIKIMHSFIDMK